ncbi:MAG TPA: FliH/SctL family protein [Miltoncostaeaceae bacterium]|nr:FliH/SctL family protein [Miltoncostaeaceae bacterium]
MSSGARAGSTLFRGAELAEAPVALSLRRPRPAAPPPPGSPQEILDAARAEADALLAGAQAQVEAALAAAREEGYRDGMAEGVAMAGAAAAAFVEAGRGLEQAAEQLREDAVREATALAVEVAARVLRAELAVRPERVADVVRGSIRRAADRSVLVARVSPRDLAACREAIPGIMEEMGGISRLEVVDDPRVSPGSCLLETSAGDVDATVESQLARILEALSAPPDETLVEGPSS